MADIAYTDLTFAKVAGTDRVTAPKPMREAIFTIAFGDNSLTYPTGGVPITDGTEPARASKALGCPNVLEELILLDQSANGKGYKFEWDRANNKILVMVETDTGTAGLAQHANATFVPNPATLTVRVRGF